MYSHQVVQWNTNRWNHCPHQLGLPKFGSEPKVRTWTSELNLQVQFSSGSGSGHSYQVQVQVQDFINFWELVQTGPNLLEPSTWIVFIIHKYFNHFVNIFTTIQSIIATQTLFWILVVTCLTTPLILQSPSWISNMSADQSALNTDGTLKDASEIQWYDSETDELPIPTVSASLTSLSRSLLKL